MKRSRSAVLLALALALVPGLTTLKALWVDAPTAGAVAQTVRSDEPAIALRADQIKLLRDALAQSDEQGFDDHEFFPPTLDGLLQSADPVQRARGQDLVVAASLRYASALHRGRLALTAFDNEWGMRPAAFDARASLLAALQQNRLKPWLDDLAPPYLGYQQLIAGLQTYRDIVARGGWDMVANGPSLKLGMSDPRVPALRARLLAEYPELAKPFADAQAQALAAAQAAQAAQTAAAPGGKPAPPATDPQLVFDPALDGALKSFQARHGLDLDGVLDRTTLQAVNVPAEVRLDQIVANMERWRWVPPVLPSDRVQVNIAAAILTLFRRDQPVLSMRAVAGRITDHTPILQSKIHSIVFNPPWNVPTTIANKELWPKERAHPGYLASDDFVVIHLPDGGTRLQQRAGPKSALGQVKFDFDNNYGVYLHDTPTHSTFGRESRLVSHGCVRLENPKALALALLQDNPMWTAPSIDTLIMQGNTQRASLSQPTDVLIFYWTAFAGPDGAMNFRTDSYGWDKELLQRIAAGRPGKA